MNKCGFPSQKEVEVLRKKHPAGTRIKLSKMDDPYSKLESGDCGTVTHVDDAGTIHVSWERGGSLGLIPDVDAFETIDDE